MELFFKEEDFFEAVDATVGLRSQREVLWSVSRMRQWVADVGARELMMFR